jgi:small subunit ribosomal protein S11
MADSKTTVKRKKTKRTVTHGQLFVLATYNNTLISVTDDAGNVLTRASSGGCGFRGNKKGTSYAAQVAAELALNNAVSTYGLRSVKAVVRGVGQGRESALRATQVVGVALEEIVDKTSIPHGGCRPKKARKG